MEREASRYRCRVRRKGRRRWWWSSRTVAYERYRQEGALSPELLLQWGTGSDYGASSSSAGTMTPQPVSTPPPLTLPLPRRRCGRSRRPRPPGSHLRRIQAGPQEQFRSDGSCYKS
ncbi:unnamed protein product [Musa acuminata var. zebrina]